MLKYLVANFEGQLGNRIRAEVNIAKLGLEVSNLVVGEFVTQFIEPVRIVLVQPVQVNEARVDRRFDFTSVILQLYKDI